MGCGHPGTMVLCVGALMGWRCPTTPMCKKELPFYRRRMLRRTPKFKIAKCLILAFGAPIELFCTSRILPIQTHKPRFPLIRDRFVFKFAISDIASYISYIL